MQTLVSRQDSFAGEGPWVRTWTVCTPGSVFDWKAVVRIGLVIGRCFIPFLRPMVFDCLSEARRTALRVIGGRVMR